MLILVIGFGSALPSCKHTLMVDVDDPGMPGDTTVTNPGDTTAMGTPCDPEVIYFERDVLPLFISNCAFSDCHDAASAQDGVVLDSYQNVINTGDIEPFDLSDSEVYEVITEDDPDKRMPPPPRNALTTDQIDIIAGWILQGAKNLTCDEDAGECDTDMVSFAMDIQPVLQNNCVGCHRGASANGGVDLSNYAGVRTAANSGRLYGAVARLEGFVPMPQGGDPLPACNVAQIGAWVDAGAPNN